ncbi:MAG: HAD-superfamily hydrolase, subfamily variant 3 [Mycobacterium sp.]|nr:HAD-superfamily hydrolase, subfamily variant 3 [Mycobacterium sp.]
MGPSFDAVLFDFHGTLMQVEDAGRWVRGAAAELGPTLTEDRAEALAEALVRAGRAGGPAPRRVPAHLAEAFAHRDLSRALHRTAYTGLYRTVDLPDDRLADVLYDRVTRPGGWVPYADAAEVLAGLRADGVTVALVSNIGFDVRPILAAHGLLDAFDDLVQSYEVGMQKPDPGIFVLACDKLGVHPGRALMVGDTVADAGAVAVGLRTLLLPASPPGAVHGLRAVRQLR